MKLFAVLSVSILLICPLAAVHAQHVNWKLINDASAERILAGGGRQPTPVLLLGTFHFDYPNMDRHKIDSSKYVDVLSRQKQAEVKELAAVIERFRPTKIYIESKRGAFHDSLYQEYVKGNYQLERNEIYQLSYRIGKDLKLPKLYAVDAESFAGDYAERFPLIDTMWNRNSSVDSVRDQYWNSRYTTVYQLGDSLSRKLTLLEYFLWLVSPNTIKHLDGNYLSGGFNTTNNDGPDVLATWWYNRNLRIFNNILRTRPASEDRILVIFGSGHVPLLRHCFESSPEFRLVELRDLLK